MALVPIGGQGSDPRYRQLLASKLIGESIAGFGAHMKQETERQALARLLGGTPAALDPGVASLDIRKAHGGAPYTPSQPGLIETGKLTPQMAQAFTGAGGNPAQLTGLMPQPITPYEQASLGLKRDELGVEREKIAAMAGQPLSGIGKIIADFGGDPRNPADIQRAAEIMRSAQAGTTVVNRLPPQFPQAPQGFHYEGDFGTGDVRLRMTPGGPAEIEAQDKATKAQASQSGLERQMRVVSRETDRVLDIIEDPDWGGGLLARAASQIPGTEAYQAQQSLVSLGAIISFDTLQRMRDASPTGGALGSITEGEIQRLQAVYGSLDIAQDPEVLAENLRAFQQELDLIVNGSGNEQPTGAQPGRPGADASFEDLVDFYDQGGRF